MHGKNSTLDMQTTVDYNRPLYVSSKGLTMTGKVRTKEKCPKCGNPFHIDEEVDIYCQSCQTIPRSFYIFLYWQGEKFKIYSDPDGYSLESHRHAHRLLESIRDDIDKGIFRLENYVQKEVRRFRGRKAFTRWYKTKAKARQKGDLRLSYTREIKRYIRKFFWPYFDNIDCRKLKKSHIKEFYDGLPSHFEPKYAQNIMRALKNFCNWMHDDEECLVMVPKFPSIKVPKKPIRWTTRDVQEKVVLHTLESDRSVFSFAIRHPVRPGELCSLKVKDFDLQKWTVSITGAFSLNEDVSRKNREAYELSLSSKFDPACLKGKTPEAYAFTDKRGEHYSTKSLRDKWKNACKRAGVPYIGFYNSTRHSTATQARIAGADLDSIRSVLGQRSIESTQHYADVDILLKMQVLEGAQLVTSDRLAELRQLKTKIKMERATGFEPDETTHIKPANTYKIKK